MNTAANIIGAPLPSILDIFLAQCSSKANSIVKDPTHPSHSLFQLLPSGRRYRSIRACAARLLNSFSPQAVRALNSNHSTPPPTPTLPHHRKNLSKYFVQFKVCYTKCVGLYKPLVVTHSPLCALDTLHTLLCVHKTE